jgi:hypothetical protein
MSALVDPLSLSAALTKAYGNEDSIRKTFGGMAHFAGTGPEGKTCRECIHWAYKRDGYHAKSGKHANMIKPQRCLRYSQLSQGKAGEAVPAQASACKYFEQSDQIRPLTRPTT